MKIEELCRKAGTSNVVMNYCDSKNKIVEIITINDTQYIVDGFHQIELLFNKLEIPAAVQSKIFMTDFEPGEIIAYTLNNQYYKISINTAKYTDGMKYFVGDSGLC